MQVPDDDNLSLDTVMMTEDSSTPKTLLEHLIDIKQQLDKEIIRLKMHNANNHGTAKWSLTGVTQKKFELSQIYQGISEGLQLLILDMTKHPNHFMFIFMARAYEIKHEIVSCMNHDANQRQNHSYITFYNCDKYIVSRENLKKIIENFDDFLPEYEQNELSNSP